MSGLKQTPSQTVGPYFAYCMTAEQYDYPFSQIQDGNLVSEDVDGTKIRIEGVVYDRDNQPISDAIIEIWQADATGRYAERDDARASNTSFKGFGRMGTGTLDGSKFVFDTIKPGPVDAGQAPHINVIVMMRGLLAHLYTRLYFEDEAERNSGDAVLQSVPEDRRATLIAKKEGAVYRFDIHMQGDDETVFFDV